MNNTATLGLRGPQPSGTQRKFVLPVETLCVLLTTGAVRSELTLLDEDDVKAAIEDHTLAPGFDIGTGGRSERRVTPSAVAFYRQTNGSRRRRISEREMFEEILKGHDGKPWITGELARYILCCGSTHLINLIEAGELEQMPGTSYRRGPNGSAQIPLPSFKDFLKRRLA